MWLRGLAIVWAVLQFALPTAVAYADAAVERESRAQVAHVEATSATTCRPLHPSDCAYCQAMSHDAARPDHAAAPRIVAVLRCPASSDRVVLAVRHAGQRPPARAPPAS